MAGRQDQPHAPRRPLWATATAALFAIALTASCFKYTGWDVVGIDDSVYRTSVLAWWHGSDPYAVGIEGNLAGTSFTYPPLALLLLAPLGLVSAVAAHNAMTLLTAACLTAASLIVAHAFQWRRTPRSWLLWLATMIVVAGALRSGNPALSALSLGQVSVFVATLCLADVVLLRGTRWSGVLIAVAAATKVTPGLFIVFMLVFARRAGIRAVAWGAALTAGAAAVLPSATWNYFTSYLWDTSRVGDAASRANVSVTGVLARLEPGPSAERWGWVLFSLIALAVSLAAVRKAWTLDSGLWAAAIIGQLTCLVSPLTWSHHASWFSITGALLVLSAVRPHGRPWVLRLATALLGLTIIYALYGLALVWSVPGAATTGLEGFLVQNVFFVIGLGGLLGLWAVAFLDQREVDRSVPSLAA